MASVGTCDTILMEAKDFSPYSILYDPIKYVQSEPLIIETQDFKCTFEYKISPIILEHNIGNGNLRQYVWDLIKDDFEMFNQEKPSQDPWNILSKDTSGIDETFISVTEYAYPRMRVTITKFTSDEIWARLGELYDLIDARSLKEITNHRRIC